MTQTSTVLHKNKHKGTHKVQLCAKCGEKIAVRRRMCWTCYRRTLREEKKKAEMGAAEIVKKYEPLEEAEITLKISEMTAEQVLALPIHPLLVNTLLKFKLDEMLRERPDEYKILQEENVRYARFITSRALISEFAAFVSEEGSEPTRGIDAD